MHGISSRSQNVPKSCYFFRSIWVTTRILKRIFIGNKMPNKNIALNINKCFVGYKSLFIDF